MAENGKSSGLVRLDWFRLSLAAYFVLYVYIVAHSLIPLPDEPPRINFWGVFCVVGGLVIAYHCLTSSYRLFLVSTWGFLLIAHWQLGKKIKFLEMMLEAKTIESVTRYSLGIIMLALLTPKAFRLFSKASKDFVRKKQLTTRKGFLF